MTSIPSGVVLCALWFASSILGLWGIVTIVLTCSMPAWLLGFQRGVFDTDHGHDSALHAAA